MDNLVADDLRNGLVGIYTERYKMLKIMLSMASALEGPSFLRKIRLTAAIRKQLASIRRMDLHLNRMKKHLVG